MYLFLNFLQIQFYFFQQNIYQIISYQLNHFNISIFLLLFTSGILTSINPCFISLLPITITATIESKHKNIFIIGLISSTIGIMILAILMNPYYQQLITHIPLLSSLIMIIIGLNLLNILQFNNKYPKNLHLYQVKFNLTLKHYITGFIIGLSSSTCSTPIIISILFWISYSKNILLGIIYLLCYLIGYISPLLLLIHMSLKSIKLNAINKIWNYLLPFSGSLLLSLGIFSLLETFFI